MGKASDCEIARRFEQLFKKFYGSNDYMERAGGNDDGEMIKEESFGPLFPDDVTPPIAFKCWTEKVIL